MRKLFKLVLSLLLVATLFNVSNAKANSKPELVTIGNPGNENDYNSLGKVSYQYQIGKFEVTNAQYVEFLNAVASKSDPHGLYTNKMEKLGLVNGYMNKGGITRSGSEGKYTYKVIENRGNLPVTNVNMVDAAFYCNWLTTGNLYEGAYSNIKDGATVKDKLQRNEEYVKKGAYVIPNETEWYKAAYYDPTLNNNQGGYHKFPTKSNYIYQNQANFNGFSGTSLANDLRVVGSYSDSPSYYGTFDQAGNAAEWTESFYEFSVYNNALCSALRGGHVASNTNSIAKIQVGSCCPVPQKIEWKAEQDIYGFRIAFVGGEENNKASVVEVSVEENTTVVEDTTNTNTDCAECKECVECKDCQECVDCKDCENCENCQDCAECKECVECKDCQECVDCKDCLECVDCKDCENCENCQDCAECKECVECKDCQECVDCKDCENCENCQDCAECKECVECKDCQECVDCKDCENCENCQDCAECKDCQECVDCKEEVVEETKQTNVDTSVQKTTVTLKDIDSKTAHASSINWLVTKGISTGFKLADGTSEFRPYANITRADFAAFLYRYAKSQGLVKDEQTTTTFIDVNTKEFPVDGDHYKGMVWMKQTGISNGWQTVNGDEFKPYANLTRADMAAFLYRLNNKEAVNTNSSLFADVNVNDWTNNGQVLDQLSGMIWLNEKGISQGWDVNGSKEFRPYSSLARADMAAFLERLSNLSN